MSSQRELTKNVPGRNPVFIKKAKGSHIFDEDGNEITINQGKTWVCVVYDTKEDQIVIE